MESTLLSSYGTGLIFPPLLPSYIYGLLTAATDNLRSIHESITSHCHRCCNFIDPVLRSTKGYRNGVFGNWQGCSEQAISMREGSLWVVDTLLFSHFSKSFVLNNKQLDCRFSRYRKSFNFERLSPDVEVIPAWILCSYVVNFSFCFLPLIEYNTIG